MIDRTGVFCTHPAVNLDVVVIIAMIIRAIVTAKHHIHGFIEGGRPIRILILGCIVAGGDDKYFARANELTHCLGKPVAAIMRPE